MVVPLDNDVVWIECFAAAGWHDLYGNEIEHDRALGVEREFRPFAGNVTADEASYRGLRLAALNDRLAVTLAARKRAVIRLSCAAVMMSSAN